MAGGSTQFYAALKPCKRGHPPIRYAHSRKCVECSKAHSIEWAQNNPVEHVNRSTAWNKNNRLAIRESCRRRYAKNPEKFIVKDARRRAVIRLSEQQHTEDDRMLILELQHAKCFYCNYPLTYSNFHGDHYIPLSKGGSNARYNITAACMPCNVSKRSKDPVSFALLKGFDPCKRPVFWSEQDGI